MAPEGGINAVAYTIRPAASEPDVTYTGDEEAVVEKSPISGQLNVRGREKFGDGFTFLIQRHKNIPIPNILNVWVKEKNPPDKPGFRIAVHRVKLTGAPAVSRFPALIQGLEDKLNEIWGAQARVFFKVSKPLPDLELNYDIVTDQMMTHPLDNTDEGDLIIQGVRSAMGASTADSFDFHIYYIHDMRPRPTGQDAAGFGFYPVPGNGARIKKAFVADDHADTTEHITAHELGHLMNIQHDTTDTNELMYGFATGSACALRPSEWNTVNP